jgi:hypothetical protein
MAVTDYVKKVRERLLLLLERHTATAEAIRVGNRDKRADTTRLGLAHKPRAGQSADFPQVEINLTGWSETAFSEPETFGHEDDDPDADWPARITLNYEAVVIHEALNQDAASLVELEMFAAWRRGRRRLADPDVAGSGLAYVLSWGPLEPRRTEEDAKGARRLVTRIAVPVRCELTEQELSPWL